MQGALRCGMLGAELHHNLHAQGPGALPPPEPGPAFLVTQCLSPHKRRGKEKNKNPKLSSSSLSPFSRTSFASCRFRVACEVVEGPDLINISEVAVAPWKWKGFFLFLFWELPWTEPQPRTKFKVKRTNCQNGLSYVLLFMLAKQDSQTI